MTQFVTFSGFSTEGVLAPLLTYSVNALNFEKNVLFCIENPFS